MHEKSHSNIIRILRTIVFSAGLFYLVPALSQKGGSAKKPVAAAATTKAKPAAATRAAKPATVPAASGGTGLSGGGGEAKALEVRGQARSLQMMMLLKSKGDDIHFVKPRKDYRPEINSTAY